MEINEKQYSLKRTSIGAFLSVSFLILVCSTLVGYNLQLQKSMLEASSVSYELRILLDRSSNQANLMFKSENVAQLSDRILWEVRDDFVRTTDDITENINHLRLLLLHESNNFGSLLRAEDLNNISLELQRIDQIWGRFQTRIDEIASYNTAVLRAGNKYWRPTDALIAYDSTLFKSISNLNHLVYEASLYQNRYLRVIYAMIFALVLIGMWIIWYFTLRPLADSLATSYEQIVAKNARLDYQANHDSLTGLLNRAAFSNKLKKIECKHTSIKACSLVLIDLDQFKEINDLLGHDVGDKVLIQAAKDITKAPMRNESAYRLGGDEFALLYDKKVDQDQLTKRLESLIEEIKKPRQISEYEIRCSCSIGVAFGHQQGCSSFKMLFKRADTALYEVKRNGRDGFGFYKADTVGPVFARSL